VTTVVAEGDTHIFLHKLAMVPSTCSPSKLISHHSGPDPLRRRKFKSARLIPGEYDEKPWALAKHPKLKWERAIFYGSIAIGVVIGAFLCYMAYSGVTNHEVISY
jgi:hypothetical protein